MCILHAVVESERRERMGKLPHRLNIGLGAELFVLWLWRFFVATVSRCGDASPFVAPVWHLSFTALRLLLFLPSFFSVAERRRLAVRVLHW